jgi:hypothetical protein
MMSILDEIFTILRLVFNRSCILISHISVHRIIAISINSIVISKSEKRISK